MKKSLFLFALWPVFAHAQTETTTMTEQCAHLMRDTLTVLAYGQACQVDDEKRHRQILAHISNLPAAQMEARFAQCKAWSERSDLAQQNQMWRIIQQPTPLTEQVSRLAQQSPAQRQNSCHALAAQWPTD